MNDRSFDEEHFARIHAAELIQALGDDFKNHDLYPEILKAAREARPLAYVLDDMRLRLCKNEAIA